MRIEEFQKVLSQKPQALLTFKLPDGTLVPEHFHVTEVGRVQKEFIDCGGTSRSVSSCVLQLWVAEDTQHRLQAGKLSRIIDLARGLDLSGLAVEVEYQTQSVSVYGIQTVETTPTGLEVCLEPKHTACLALDLCIVPSTGACCSDTQCC